MKALSLVLVAGLCGCTTAPNPKSCADNFCHDPALPFCDVDGSISGTPNTCVAVECTPNEFAGCRDDELLTCNAAGTDYNVATCEFGCNEAAKACNACVPGTADCEPHIIPMHMPDGVCNTFAPHAALVISSSKTLDTDDDNVCTGGVIDQSIGADVCVLRHKSISIQAGATVTVIGTRAIALVADDEVTIAGTFDVSANGVTNGPGGGVIKSGGTVGIDEGAGGAGFKTAGGAGGTATVHGGANNGGTAQPNPSLTTELVGGTQNMRVNQYRPEGGGGGGAANFISCRATVAVSGLIDAGGGGGAAGYNDGVGTTFGAGGGGSGGFLVFQGMMVDITGEIYANGGGGGASRYSPLPEDAGEDGTRSATVSAAGGVGYQGTSAGGSGGRHNMLPGVGLKPGYPETPAGAGGGGTGFLQSYTPSGVLPMLDAQGVSPIFEPNGTVQTR